MGMSLRTGLIFLAVYLLTITVHEFSHGLIAYFCGDNTAKERGRLTLNPLRHIDPLWTIVLPFIMLKLGLPAIGMARPVPVDFSRLNRPKTDMIWVALAGPAANLVFASLLASLFRITGEGVFLLAVYFNLGLAVFNLIPVPPLDGSRVLMGILPGPLAYSYARIEPYGFLIIVTLVWLGLLWHLIIPALNFFCRALGVPPVGP